MPHSVHRLIPLEGCLNFRDLGGYPAADGRQVRWGQLFRSDALQFLTAADVQRLREELRLGAIVDLRTSEELRSEGRGPLAEEPIAFHHIPLFDSGASTAEPGPGVSLADRYFLMAELAKGAIVRVLTTLAETEAPAVYHCAAGKDRTGVISALVLGLLGVPEEIIVADYARTQQQLDLIVERLNASAGYQAALEALPPETLHASPETMSNLLERVRQRYGSVRAYVQEAGVSEDAVQRLVDRLLEG